MKTNYISPFHVAVATATGQVPHIPGYKHVKRVGLWDMEWEPHRPNTVWVIPARHKAFHTCDSGVLYEDGTVGWSYLTAPKYVRVKAARFICNAKYAHARAIKSLTEQPTEKE